MAIRTLYNEIYRYQVTQKLSQEVTQHFQYLYKPSARELMCSLAEMGNVLQRQSVQLIYLSGKKSSRDINFTLHWRDVTLPGNNVWFLNSRDVALPGNNVFGDSRDVRITNNKMSLNSRDVKFTLPGNNISGNSRDVTLPGNNSRHVTR